MSSKTSHRVRLFVVAVPSQPSAAPPLRRLKQIVSRIDLESGFRMRSSALYGHVP
jgi:hypothetical protein